MTSTEKSHILFVQPAMLKNRTILCLDQRIEVLCRLGEAHHVERLLPSQCGKTQMALMISKQTQKATVAYIEYKHSRTVGLQYLSCYVALILSLLNTIAYIIMTIHVFIRNIGGGDSTVVPATAGPLGERPPALAGHFCDVPTTLPC